jgi:hypothetical protein
MTMVSTSTHGSAGRTTSGRATSDRTTSDRVSAFVAIVLLLALTGWATTAGPDEVVVAVHPSPGTVETVEGSEFSWVTLTAAGAEEIGLEVTGVERARHPAGRLAVPHAALVHGADGTIWVYAAADERLRFRRRVVEVAAVEGSRAILARGPLVGTLVAGLGSAELYGTEFEVGH